MSLNNLFVCLFVFFYLLTFLFPYFPTYIFSVHIFSHSKELFCHTDAGSHACLLYVSFPLPFYLYFIFVLMLFVISGLCSNFYRNANNRYSGNISTSLDRFVYVCLHRLIVYRKAQCLMHNLFRCSTIGSQLASFQKATHTRSHGKTARSKQLIRH